MGARPRHGDAHGATRTATRHTRGTVPDDGNRVCAGSRGQRERDRRSLIRNARSRLNVRSDCVCVCALSSHSLRWGDAGHERAALGDDSHTGRPYGWATMDQDPFLSSGLFVFGAAAGAMTPSSVSPGEIFRAAQARASPGPHVSDMHVSTRAGGMGGARATRRWEGPHLVRRRHAARHDGHTRTGVTAMMTDPRWGPGRARPRRFSRPRVDTVSPCIGQRRGAQHGTTRTAHGGAADVVPCL